MKAKSIKGKSPEEISSALQQAISNGYKPTLAFVFLSDPETSEPIRAMLHEESIAIFGASTSQKFTEEGMVADDSIVLLLLNINPNYFRIVLKDYTQSPPFEAARHVGEAGMQVFKNPGFIISAVDIRVSGEELISGLTDTAGNNVTVMGGVAGNPADFSGIIFTNEASSTKGIIALVIDQDKISINGLAVSGWKPVGTEKKITKSDSSWIFTIDNEPAMNVIQKFLGMEIITDNKQAKGLIPSDLGYPLQFQRAAGSFLMMPLLVWNTDDKSVMVGGESERRGKFSFFAAT